MRPDELDPCPGGMLERDLVAFVVDQEKALILGEPALVRVCAASVADSRQLYLFELIGGVNDGQRIFVRVETDFTVAIDSVGAVVDNALRLVRVAVETETASRTRRRGRAYVDRVQTAFAGTCAGGIRESRTAVDGERVCRSETGVVRGFCEGDRRRGDIPKLPQVEHLHAVVDGLADDERVIGKHLDAAPRRMSGFGRQVAKIDRPARHGNVHERGAG